MKKYQNISKAFNLLGQFWLREVQQTDLPILSSLPGLGETLDEANEASLLEMAAEYQRLFGFNLPPYESVFIDPSGMINAPATWRLQERYIAIGWQPPAAARAAAPDHLGLELLALADMLAAANTQQNAIELWGQHLALWAPVYLLTLRCLNPFPFYKQLAELTLDLLLQELPTEAVWHDDDPFPALPPAPIYQATQAAFQTPPGTETPAEIASPAPAHKRLGRLVQHLLTPSEAGVYLTRQEIAILARSLELPTLMGERQLMLTGLFEQAGQYEQMQALVERLVVFLEGRAEAYRNLVTRYPLWYVYGQAWLKRVIESLDTLSASD